MNLATLLKSTAGRTPNHPAIRFQEQSITYAELSQRVDSLAAGLGASGLKPGDVCVLMMPNSINWVTAYYALAKLGSVILPINFLYRTSELQHIFRDSGARAFIGQAAYLEEARKAMKGLPEIDIRVADGTPAAGFTSLAALFVDHAAVLTYAAQDDEPLALIYTSGTTGLPKGAILTHRNLVSNALTVGDMRHTEPGDVVLGVLPFFHIYGQTSILNASIYLGLTVRLWVHFEAQEVFSAIEEERNSILIAVPTVLNRLAEMASVKPPKRSSLRFCVSGGASLPVEVLKRFESLFHTTIYEGYGLTECSPVCVENPYGRPTRPGSIGVPIPGFEARVVDEMDRDVGRGEVGELIVRGPGVMKGYLHQPEATEEILRGGWLHTGDLAKQDQEGYIYIVDRKKEMVIRGGYNVYPREVEEILYTHPAVSEAAVLGVPHPDLGEEVAALLVLRPGAEATAEEIRAFVKAKVAPYKYPRLVKFVEQLPKTATGKILKRAIPHNIFQDR